MRAVWTSPEPFDYEGEFYTVQNAFSDVKPLQKPSIPIYFGGASGAAVPVGAKHADVYMFWGEPLAETKARMECGARRGAARTLAGVQRLVSADPGRDGERGLGQGA